MGRRIARIVAVAVAAVVVSACQLRAEVNVTVADDGSGTVEIAVGLDDDSATLRPDLLTDLDVDHLIDAGWEVTGPLAEDGFQWIRARHDFEDPSEVTELVDAVAGDSGPFRDFEITQSQSFASSSTHFSGTVDFTGLGESRVADDVIEASGEVDGPAAEAIGELGDRFGAAVDEIVQVSVAVRLPGDVDSNASTKADNGGLWRPSVTSEGPLHLEATGTTSRPGRVAVAVVGVIAAVAAVLAGSVRIALWRRRRSPEK